MSFTSISKLVSSCGSGTRGPGPGCGGVATLVCGTEKLERIVVGMPEAQLSSIAGLASGPSVVNGIGAKQEKHVDRSLKMPCRVGGADDHGEDRMGEV